MRCLCDAKFKYQIFVCCVVKLCIRRRILWSKRFFSTYVAFWIMLLITTDNWSILQTENNEFLQAYRLISSNIPLKIKVCMQEILSLVRFYFLTLPVSSWPWHAFCPFCIRQCLDCLLFADWVGKSKWWQGESYSREWEKICSREPNAKRCILLPCCSL